MAWAATWMYVATGTITYLEDAYNYWTMHRNVSPHPRIAPVCRAHAAPSCDPSLVALAVVVTCCTRELSCPLCVPSINVPKVSNSLSRLTHYRL